MNATTSSSRADWFVPDQMRHWRTLVATTRASFLRQCAYLINIIRIPLWPAMLYVTALLAYDVAEREVVGGVNVPGFLMIGLIASLTWSASVWGAGSAIDDERVEGTIAALFLSPASRVAVIAGAGLAGLIFLIPALLILLVLGFATGAELSFGSIVAIAAASAALLAASVGTGLLLAAFFVLSRRANLMANVVQHPISLLAGFIVDRSELPGWLHVVSDCLPVAHALDAFRASTLTGASFSNVAESVALAFGLAVVYALIGAYGTRRVEHAAKRGGQLDLF
jgi:ABC-2 type transport system permease protein